MHHLTGGVALAVAAVAVTTGLALAVDADATAFALLLVLTVQVTALRGLRPGLVAALLGAASFSYFFIEPRGDLVLLGTRDEVLALAVLVTVACIAAVLLQRAQRAGARADLATADAEASARRAALFAGIGHDLRTPLAGIRAGIDALAGPTGTDPVASEELRAAIGRETRRLERVLERIVQVARLDTGELRLDVEPVDLVGVVQSCVSRLDTDRRCSMDVRPPDGVLIGDPVLLEQAVGNVVDNALEHGGPGKVLVTGRTSGSGYLLAVADEGPGVDDRLRRAVESRVGVPGGVGDGRPVGLGLQIVRAVVHAHGGRVRCRPGAGGGAVVEIEVPLR